MVRIRQGERPHPRFPPDRSYGRAAVVLGERLLPPSLRLGRVIAVAESTRPTVGTAMFGGAFDPSMLRRKYEPGVEIGGLDAE